MLHNIMLCYQMELNKQLNLVMKINLQFLLNNNHTNVLMIVLKLKSIYNKNNIVLINVMRIMLFILIKIENNVMIVVCIILIKVLNIVVENCNVNKYKYS